MSVKSLTRKNTWKLIFDSEEMHPIVHAVCWIICTFIFYALDNSRLENWMLHARWYGSPAWQWMKYEERK